MGNYTGQLSGHFGPTAVFVDTKPGVFHGMAEYIFRRVFSNDNQLIFQGSVTVSGCFCGKTEAETWYFPDPNQVFGA